MRVYAGARFSFSLYSFLTLACNNVFCHQFWACFLEPSSSCFPKEFKLQREFHCLIFDEHLQSSGEASIHRYCMQTTPLDCIQVCRAGSRTACGTRCAPIHWPIIIMGLGRCLCAATTQSCSGTEAAGQGESWWRGASASPLPCAPSLEAQNAIANTATAQVSAVSGGDSPVGSVHPSAPPLPTADDDGSDHVCILYFI